MKPPRILAPFAGLLLAATPAFGQDAPDPAEPTIKLDGDAEDDAKDKVKILDEESEAAADAIGEPEGDPNPEVVLRDDQPGALPPSVLALSEEDRRKLGGLLEDAATYLGGIRVQEAFEKLVQAEAMVEDYAPIHNLKGAAYTKLRDFEKAKASFARAVELNPGAFMSLFNLTEIYFVTGDFETANSRFKQMLSENPKMPEGTRALIRYKMLIGHLKQGNEADAKGILDTFDFLDDHPAYYFSNAAFCFNSGDDDEAKEWIASASKIYQKNQIDIYTDSFIEVGWIENLQ